MLQLTERSSTCCKILDFCADGLVQRTVAPQITLLTLAKN